jgi:hypothetical protein
LRLCGGRLVDLLISRGHANWIIRISKLRGRRITWICELDYSHVKFRGAATRLYRPAKSPGSVSGGSVSGVLFFDSDYFPGVLKLTGQSI